jgi:hypothetical protein
MNFPIARSNDTKKESIDVPTKNPLNFSMKNINFNKIETVPEGVVVPATKADAEKQAERKKLKAEKQEKKAVNEFKESYRDNENLLKEVILETDLFTRDLKDQMDLVKNSKTLKNKHMIYGELQANITSLIGTKLSAVKELNSIIHNSQNMGLKKAKDNAELTNSNNEDKLIMDLYRAMMEGKGGMTNNASIVMPTYDQINAIPAAFVGLPTNNSMDDGYNNYINNRSAAQLGMIMDSNPNIQTVVRYNPNNGLKKFDVVDISTGQSLPKFERPDAMFLDDTIIDSNTWTAKNNNMNMIYDVMVDYNLF